MRLDKVLQPVSGLLKRLKNDLNSLDSKHKDLSGDFIRYVFESSGKLLRPAVVFLSVGAVNPDILKDSNDELVGFALGVELLHTASLIHDDIIDGDLRRRERQSANRKFGNRLAVLGGDIIYARAFDFIDKFGTRCLRRRFRQVTVEMCRGEFLETRKDAGIKTYLETCRLKTAVLFEFSCSAASSFTGSDETIETILADYGRNFGMAYQLVDDLLDGDFLEIDVDRKNQINQFLKSAHYAIKKLPVNRYGKAMEELLLWLDVRSQTTAGNCEKVASVSEPTGEKTGNVDGFK